MIIEIIQDITDFKKGDRLLVLEVGHEFKRNDQKEICYTVLDVDIKAGFYLPHVNVLTSLNWINYDECKIISPTIPSGWGFEICHDKNYFYSRIKPEKWLDKNWTYTFWEACDQNEGIDPLEAGRAEKCFFEEVNRIYEECGKGYIPDPFAKENA